MLTALIGLNGSGKTTHLTETFHSLTGGKPSTHVSFLHDNPVIPVELTAVELIQRIGRLRGLTPQTSRDRAHELVELLLIDGGLDRPVRTYSTGNYKKTALACVLVHAPKILLLDEPLETVDAVVAETVMRLLLLLSQRGVDITISTQDLSLAMRAERVKVFKSLRIVRDGHPREIFGPDPFADLLSICGETLPTPRLDWYQ